MGIAVQTQQVGKLAPVHLESVILPAKADRLPSLLPGPLLVPKKGMDENNRRRRQNEPPYEGSDPRFNADQSQGRRFSGSASDRYRTAPLAAAPSTGRGAGGATPYQGYYPEPSSSFSTALPQTAMQYQPGYQQDQRQQQPFTTNFGPELMYTVTQQAPPSSVYDPTPQFQNPRQPAAMQMLSDVAVPYFPSEAAVSGPPGLQHHAPSNSSTGYQQHQQSPGDRPPLLQQSYPANIGMGGMPQGQANIMGGGSGEEGDDFQTQGPGMEAAYTAYQTALKEIFQNIINGRLVDASRSLLEVSEWLLGHVGDLGKPPFLLLNSPLIVSDEGLTVDEASLHGDRIRLWEEFNNAWLAIFQKQKDMLESGQRIQNPQSLISRDFISKMSKDLIRMCDAVEKYGLVDYQCGVAEERIIDSKYKPQAS